MQENFDEDPDSEFNMDRYKSELINNPILLERRYLATKAKEDNAAAFDDWMQLKAVRENSLRYLSLLKPPVLTVSAKDLGGTFSLNGSVAMGDSNPARGSRQPSLSSSARLPLVDRDPGVKLVIEVGQALKKADRALFSDFVRYCHHYQHSCAATTIINTTNTSIPFPRLLKQQLPHYYHHYYFCPLTLRGPYISLPSHNRIPCLAIM